MSPGTLAFADYLIPQRAGNSGARVRFVVHPQQLADEGMCVSLRGRERAVVKPLMNAAKVCVKKMAVLGVLFLSVLAASARAQNNYEIQVYGSDLVEPGHTMVELHSNFTIQGFKTMMDGVYPDNHAEHETVEITHGFTPWFECGLYIFTSMHSGQGWDWVGDHIRPRFTAPESWRWPVGVSISNEIGYQRRVYSVDTWT